VSEPANRKGAVQKADCQNADGEDVSLLRLGWLLGGLISDIYSWGRSHRLTLCRFRIYTGNREKSRCMV